MSKNNIQKDKLSMTFTPNTIEHLGVKLYSTLPPIIAELVANAYDADATEVLIHLKDEEKKEIIVSDNGHGMSFSEINTKFLRIGRNRRSEENQQKSPKGRKVIGKKGLGKLSFFGIAHEIEIHTTKHEKRNSFFMKWGDILSLGEQDQQQDYSPVVIEKNIPSKKKNGTIFFLRDIQRLSAFSADSLADSISKFFIIDSDFKIFVKRNDDESILIDNERKYSTLGTEIQWSVPADIELITDYENKDKVTGQLIATRKPIPPSTNMKGITLFSRKKLVNLPEYFSDSTSSHFFTYLTGWLEVDFIDEIGEDVIGTNRQSLNWDHPETMQLRKFLQKLLRWTEVNWRTKRAAIRQANLSNKSGVDIGAWRKQIPDNINKNLDPVISALINDAELDEEKTSHSILGLQEIIKPHPRYHWQNLHPTLHQLAFRYYKSEDYFTAVCQGVIAYKNQVQAVTGSELTDKSLLENIFSLSDPKLSVTKKYKKPNGGNFDRKTISNITEGHRNLVLAIWQAFRCPLSHEAHEELKNSDLFTEQDCLDALGLLSHLFRRLENSEKP